MQVALDTMWVLITAMLVFFMNLGFAMVESGFARRKNTVNILSKNFIVFAVSSLAFVGLGWGIMFGDGNMLVGLKGLFFMSGMDNSPARGEAYRGVYSALAWAGVPLAAKVFFQMVFAGTAATIVSGAVAERIKYVSFIIFSFLLVGLVYPVVGHWAWGGGWLGTRGFLDFSGSTVIHSVGGWAALAGIIFLGPRFGKYNADGSVNPMPGHNMTAATLGAFVLWFGWFGFNPGSTMAADPEAIARIALLTNMAAVSGAATATLLCWKLLGKPELGMTINGCLAGLVAITAPCAFVSLGASILIGALGGILVVLGVVLFDRLQLDDPVGALSVHLLNGIWGTLAVGLFALPSLAGGQGGLFYGGGWNLLVTQGLGVLSVGAFTMAAASIIWHIIRQTIGIRVNPAEELEGLDIGEHGNQAYPEFVARETVYAINGMATVKMEVGGSEENRSYRSA